MYKNKKLPDKILSGVGYIFMALCVFVALYPIVWVILSSFKSNKEILAGSFSLPTSFDFSGYKDALEMAPILKFFLNSFVVSIISTVINVLALSMAGYVFARAKFKGKNLLFGILSLTMTIPSTALIHPIYLEFTKLGLYNTRTALILIYAALNMPVSLMIMRRTFENLPAGLEEAAYLDGASFTQTFFRVMLPCAKGGVSSAAVLAFLGAWNEFTFALILTSSTEIRTLPLAFSYFTSQFSFNYTALFAAISMAVIPSIIVFAIFQENVISSMTAGSIKE